MPYRQYIFEVKLENVENIIECKTSYLLSSSYNTFLEDVYNRGYIKIDNKQYPFSNVEYTKLINTNTYYSYVWDTPTDRCNLLWNPILEDLIKRQKRYFKYAKYLTPKKLKEIMDYSKNHYV